VALAESRMGWGP